MGRTGRIGRIALLVLSGSSDLSDSSDLHAQSRADLKAYFQQAVAEEGIVGAGMYLVTRDGVIDSGFAGFADREAGRRVNGATIWHWASITKTFGAIAVMQYRERGRVGLDDPIVKYVPELGRAHNPYGPMSQVTVRQLLSHTSGFRSGTWPWGGTQPWHPFEPTGWEQVVAMLPYTTIEFPPGSKYQYSNPGYVFLGQMVSRLAGEDWEVYLQKNVLSPLGMTRAYFDVTPYHLLKDRSNNYSVKDGVTTANGLDFDTGITVSNGGLNAPLADMAKYLRFLLGAMPGDANPIPRTTLEEMWRVQAPSQAGEVLGTGVGLGYFIEQRGEVRLIGHTGSQAGFRSFFWIHPESGLGIIANFNTAAASGEPAAKPNTGRVFQGMIERFVALARAGH